MTFQKQYLIAFFLLHLASRDCWIQLNQVYVSGSYVVQYCGPPVITSICLMGFIYNCEYALCFSCYQ